VSSLAIGGSHYCYVNTDKRGRCWGRGQEGQLGHGSQPIGVVTNPVEVIGLWDIEDIAVSDFTTCARRTNGRLACWGSNQGGFLGSGESAPLSSVPVDYQGMDEVRDLSMNSIGACVVRRGDVWCWGSGVSEPTLVSFP
jgi:alpha-tubulin suppressor-like RCC1 family protein